MNTYNETFNNKFEVLTALIFTEEDGVADGEGSLKGTFNLLISEAHV